MSTGAAILLLGTIYLVLYSVVTRIVHRNSRIPGRYRLLFSLTAMPVFTAAMLFNIWLSQRLAPGLFTWLEPEVDHEAGQLETFVIWWQGEDIGAVAAFLIAAPVALLLRVLVRIIFPFSTPIHPT